MDIFKESAKLTRNQSLSELFSARHTGISTPILDSVLGEMRARNNNDRNNYSFRHTFTAPNYSTIYYRLRMEEINNTYTYSPLTMIGDGRYTGIKIYPTVIQTRSMNVISGVPIEQINITSMDGRVVMSKQINGVDDITWCRLLVRGLDKRRKYSYSKNGVEV